MIKDQAGLLETMEIKWLSPLEDDDYLMFTANPVGSRIGKIVLVQYHGPEDPETGGAYTVKKYNSDKVVDETGSWQHKQIVLSPLNPEFSQIIIDEDEAGAVKVIAEYIGILGKQICWN